MTWLRVPHPSVVPPRGFDAVIVDLPDPDNPVLGRLYSAEFYMLITHALAPHGLMVVQSGSPYSTPTVFWRTVSTIQSVGFAVTPYHVDVPTFGDWGFTLARLGPEPPVPRVPKDAPPLRFLSQQVLDASTVFATDEAPQHLEPSTLDHPRIVDDMRAGYR
jgi:spermidine synthase